MENDNPAASETPATLPANGGSAAGTALESGSPAIPATPPAAATNDQTRINDLMSKWQKEESEASRLRTVLAVQIEENNTLRQKLSDIEAGQVDLQGTIKTELQTSEAKVVELTGKLSTADGELVRLRYLVANPDLAQFASILPADADAAKLDEIGKSIRAARSADREKLKDSLTTGAKGTGQTPRGGSPNMTAAEIAAYLDLATSPADFNQRMSVVTGGKAAPQ